MPDEKKKKGFGGLSSLATDLDAQEAKSRGEKKAEVTKKAVDSKPRSGNQASNTNDGISSGTQDTNPSQVAAASASSNRAGSARASSVDVSSTPAVSGVGAASSATQQGGKSEPSASGISGGQVFAVLVVVIILFGFLAETEKSGSPVSSGVNNASTPAPSSMPASPRETGHVSLSSLVFSKPPVGKGLTLNIAQIRWCVREDIIIEARRPLATDSWEIEKFNAIVEGYNPRCGSFRYKRGHLKRAKKEIEIYRAQIEEKALGLRDQRSSSSKVARSPVIFEIQQRLVSLGYPAGSPDGIFGKKTRNAIIAFERDYGFPILGDPSTAFLESIRGLTSSGKKDEMLLQDESVLSCSPSSFGAGGSVQVRLGPGHGDEMAITRHADNQSFFLVVGSSPTSMVSLMSTQELRTASYVKLKSDLVGFRGPENEKVFSKPGLYTLSVSENIESEYPRYQCTFSYLIESY